MTFTFGSLFSGIGGIDLGLERAGMQCTWQVEIDKYAQKVLAKHWPNVTRHRDVRECGRDTLAGVDLIAGGFPCQPHSLAGERQASEDERDLWPEFYRLICELKPRWVLGENVLGLLSSESGSFFSTILRQLAEAGYDAEWFVLRASDVGAPHQRERVFFVAHTNWLRESGQERAITTRQCSTSLSASVCRWEDSAEMAHAGSSGRQEWDASAISREQGFTTGRVETRPTPGQPQSRLGGMFDGLSTWLDQYRWPVGPGEVQHNWEPARVITERHPTEHLD